MVHVLRLVVLHLRALLLRWPRLVLRLRNGLASLLRGDSEADLLRQLRCLSCARVQEVPAWRVQFALQRLVVGRAPTVNIVLLFGDSVDFFLDFLADIQINDVLLFVPQRLPAPILSDQNLLLLASNYLLLRPYFLVVENQWLIRARRQPARRGGQG